MNPCILFGLMKHLRSVNAVDYARDDTFKFSVRVQTFRVAVKNAQGLVTCRVLALIHGVMIHKPLIKTHWLYLFKLGNLVDILS